MEDTTFNNQQANKTKKAHNEGIIRVIPHELSQLLIEHAAQPAQTFAAETAIESPVVKSAGAGIHGMGEKKKHKNPNPSSKDSEFR